MAVRTTRPLKQAEIVARAITAQIVSERLAAGTKLENEREMLELYQVGRSTLREALRLLESRGVLTIRSGRDGGPIVRHPRPSDLGESLTLLLQFEAVPSSEVYAARQALEPRVTRMAAERATDEIAALLHASNVRMAQVLDDRQRFRDENIRFHQLVASAACSPVLEILCATLESVAGGLAYGQVDGQFTREQRSGVLRAHEQIAAAVSQRDPEAAEEAMRAHLEEGFANWQAAYRDMSAPVPWTSVSSLAVR
jgi:DNA-binding FadR family transcriptional regulator